MRRAGLVVGGEIDFSSLDAVPAGLGEVYTAIFSAPSRAAPTTRAGRPRGRSSRSRTSPSRLLSPALRRLLV